MQSNNVVERFAKSGHGSWKLEPPTASELEALIEAVGNNDDVFLMCSGPGRFYLMNRTLLKVKVLSK